MKQTKMSRAIFVFKWNGLMKTCLHCEITNFIAKEICAHAKQVQSDETHSRHFIFFDWLDRE